MKVLHINTSDTGGAAASCVRLHLGLLQSGVSTKVFVKQFEKQNVPLSSKFSPPRHSLRFDQQITSKAIRLMRRSGLLPRYSKEELEFRRQGAFKASRPAGLEFFSYPFSDCDITQSDLYQEADIINLHWTADFLDWPSFFSKVRKPVVWTLHDQNPFLGGEHYRERFYGMDDNGHPLPRTYTEKEKLEEERLIQIKQDYLATIQSLTIVTPSKWMFNESRHSLLFQQFPHHHIPYGFPTEVFRPLDQTACRDLLGLPADKPLLLFVAESVADKRKGFAYLQKALSSLPSTLEGTYALAVIGAGGSMKSEEAVFELGRIHDERLMAAAYNAADLFIIPSLEDNLPNTVLESLGCGTPVLGFPTGGIPDMVVNDANGLLAREISVPALAERITKFLINPPAFNRTEISASIAEKHSLKSQADRYIKVYESLLDLPPVPSEQTGVARKTTSSLSGLKR